MGQYNDTLVGNLRRQIELLEIDNVTLRSEVNRLFKEHETDVENIRLILLDSLSAEQSGYVDVNILANSIADVLGISLMREVTVAFNIAVEATMLVPAGFDISDLDVTDVNMEAWNSEVEDFSVQSFEFGGAEEV
jgi:hypothetical protein